MRLLDYDETETEPIDVTQITEFLIRIPLVTATLPPATCTNSYLVQHVEKWVLVDIGGDGTAASLQPLIDVIEERADGQLHGVMITHEHPDHHAGLEALYALYPNLVTYAHPHTVARLRDAYPFATWQEIQDGDTWMGFEVLLTEGHAKGHLALVSPEAVLVGDMMAGIGTIVVAPPDGDMVAYMASLERLAERGDRWCLPSHGGASRSIRERAQFYISHRLMREEKIFAVLATDRSMSLEEVTERAYDDVPKALHGFAQRSALAHLIKLKHDRRAIDHRASWRALVPAP